MKINDATELAYDQLNEGFKQGYEQGKIEGRKEAILYVRKLIKIFWKDWNNTSHKRLPYLAFEELDEHILEQADESNGREFMQWYKEQNNDRSI